MNMVEGQTKVTFVYRLLSANTFEEQIYYRTIRKQEVTDFVVDEHNLQFSVQENEVKSLFIQKSNTIKSDALHDSTLIPLITDIN